MKSSKLAEFTSWFMSRPARGVWIEMAILKYNLLILRVAPREGRVD